MRKHHSQTTEIHECAFEAQIVHTNAAVKFSCKMFVAWKNVSNKTFCKTINDNVTVQDGIATFNENLSFQTYMLFDKATSKYLKKQTSLCLLLVSTRKPDQQKLVGRVVIDLSQVLNQNAYSQVTDHKLSFCSIKDSSITFKVSILSNIKTDMKPMQLDMDEFSIISRNLNQSSSSNNQDLLAFKSIGKDQSITENDKQKQIKNQKGFNLSSSRSKEILIAKNQPLDKIEPEPEANLRAQVHLQQISQPQQQQTQQMKIQNANMKQKHNEKQQQEQSDLVQPLPKSSKYKAQLGREGEENPQILELKFQNKKLQNENQKLIQIIEQVNNELSEQKNEAQRWRRMYEQLESHSQRLETQKTQQNDVIQQLLAQVKDITNKCSSVQAKLKEKQKQKQKQKDNKSSLQIEALNKKIAKLNRQYEESEILRLDNQSELLQVRYELSELKTERQVIDSQIKAKDEQIDKLYKHIEEMRSLKYQQQIERDRSLHRSLSMMSDRERSGYADQVELLKRKMNKLLNELQFTEKVRDNLSQFNHACQQLQVQKDSLLAELNNIKQQKDLLIKQKQKQDGIVQMVQQIKTTGPTLQNKIQYLQQQLKALQSELRRNQQKKQKLQVRIKELENQNNKLKQDLQAKWAQVQMEIQKKIEPIHFQSEIQKKLQEKTQQVLKISQLLQSKQQQAANFKQLLQNKERELQQKQFFIDSMENIKEQLENKQKQLDAALENINAKQIDIRTLQHLIQKNQKEYKNKLQKLENQKSNQTQKPKQSQQLSQKYIQVSQTLQSTNKLLGKKQKQLLTFKEQSQKLKDQTSKLIYEKQCVLLQVESNKAEIEKLQQKLIEDDINMKSLQSQIKQLKGRTEQSKTVILEISKQNESLKKKLSNLSSQTSPKLQANGPQLKSNDQLIQQKQKQINQLRVLLLTEKAQVAQLEQRITKFAQKQVKMRQNIVILEEESRKIYDIVVDKEQNQQAQAQALQQKDMELQNLRYQLQQKNALLQIANEQLAEYKKQLYESNKQKINGRNQQAHQAHQSLIDELKSFDVDESIKLKEMIKLNSDRINQLEQQVHVKDQQKHIQVQSLQFKINLIQKQCDSLRQRIYGLEQERDELRSQRIQLASQIERYQNSNVNNQIHQQLLQKQRQIIKLQQQIDTLLKSSKQDNPSKVHQSQQAMAPPNTPLYPNQIKEALQRKVRELTNENQMMETQLANQEHFIAQLKEQLQQKNSNIKNLKSQLEDNEVEKLNIELEKQFKQVKDKEKGQSSQIRKSGIVSSNSTSASEIVEACKCLQDLLKQRCQKDKTQSIIQLMMSKNAILEEQLTKIAEERGTIQQNARKLSMEFQRVKSNILKGKGNFQEKNQLLSHLKPCEVKVKDLVQLSEKLFESQIDIQNY